MKQLEKMPSFDVHNTAKTVLWNGKYSSRDTRHERYRLTRIGTRENPTSVSKQTVVASLLQIVSHFSERRLNPMKHENQSVPFKMADDL